MWLIKSERHPLRALGKLSMGDSCTHILSGSNTVMRSRSRVCSDSQMVHGESLYLYEETKLVSG